MILLCELARARERKNFKKGESPFLLASYLFCPSIQKRPLSWPKNRWQSGIRKERKGGQRKGWKSVGRKRRGSRRSAFKIMRSLLCLLSPSPLPTILLIPPKQHPARLPSPPIEPLLLASSFFSFFSFFISRFPPPMKETTSPFVEVRRASRLVSSRATILIKIQRFVDYYYY